MSTVTIASQSQYNERIETSKLLIAGILTIFAASLANLVIYWLGLAFGWVPADSQLLQPASIIVSSVVGVVGATAVLWLINKFSRRPIWLFRIVTAVFLLLSLGGPLSAANGGMPGVVVSAQTALIMAAMHIATALIALTVLTTWPRRSK